MNHQSPEWVDIDSDYFITICAEPRKQNHLCLSSVGAAVLKSIQYYHEAGRWYCHIAVVMPDHVHMLLNFPDIASISPVIGDWKRWLTKHCGLCWQENFFEHRLRNNESGESKAQYIMQNPVRAGLISDGEVWPYFWFPSQEADGKRPLFRP